MVPHYYEYAEETNEHIFPEDLLPVLHWLEVVLLLEEIVIVIEEEPPVVSCNEFSRVAVKGYLKLHSAGLASIRLAIK